MRWPRITGSSVREARRAHAASSPLWGPGCGEDPFGRMNLRFAGSRSGYTLIFWSCTVSVVLVDVYSRRPTLPAPKANRQARERIDMRLSEGKSLYPGIARETQRIPR